ncbi:MAG: hypothetical protein JETT_0112 [Candidatus Jettenia ecosi]|uniref:Sigma factor RpoE regulatory protein RseC n=1 Tax=Candidatus Jettenia ecosi TaxID=2494326 RepID=A0A533QLK1_9BACT|nr:MAG: hypothetical protein JETT_0112 [Candidatus Jettenia ecosi]
MEIRGKIVSIHGNSAEVCIILENKACGSCSACPKKMGVQDIVQVAVIEGVQVGQEVVLRSNKNWFTKNTWIIIVIAFVLGLIITEAISMAVSFGAYRKNIDILGASIVTVIVSIIVWLKRPQYLFRIELTKRGKT